MDGSLRGVVINEGGGVNDVKARVEAHQLYVIVKEVWIDVVDIA